MLTTDQMHVRGSNKNYALIFFNERLYPHLKPFTSDFRELEEAQKKMEELFGGVCKEIRVGTNMVNFEFDEDVNPRELDVFVEKFHEVFDIDLHNPINKASV